MSSPTLTATPTRPRDRAVSDFTELTRTIQAAGLMKRRPAHYAVRLSAAVVAVLGLDRHDHPGR